ncbi:MAG: DUF1616 domain-containing protein [Dehalococcoidales bacterium]|nr:DUF1616 domain-containing protein [Dehalococcoidales bacterium]
MMSKKTDLFIIIACSLLLVPLALLTSGALRIILSLAFVLFFPGYTLIAALFPAKGRLDGIERVALSFGLSLAVVPLIGLVLNFTPWGIRFEPILFSLLGFILAMSAVALYRRAKLLSEECFAVDFGGTSSRLTSSWAKQGRWDRLLTVLLTVAIIGTIGTVAYAVQTPRASEKFTEFYILGPGGKAVDYPREAILGMSSHVIAGIINREQETTTYQVEIAIDGEKVEQIGPLTLIPDEKWEQPVSFNATNLGLNRKVEFRLYRGGASDPYRSLHLWLDVKER